MSANTTYDCDGVFEERETLLVRQFVIDGILCEVRRQEREEERRW